MKKYIYPENERYQFIVLDTLNGFSIEVLVVSTGDIAGLTPQVAAQLQVSLPDLYRLQSCTRPDAEAELDRLAALNGWTLIEERK